MFVLNLQEHLCTTIPKTHQMSDSEVGRHVVEGTRVVVGAPASAAAEAFAAADVAGAAGRSSRENATPFDNGASKRSGGDIVMRKSDKMAMVRLTVAILPWLRPSTRVLVARIPFERQAAMR